jgi:hypothetical protein
MTLPSKTDEGQGGNPPWVGTGIPDFRTLYALRIPTTSREGLINQLLGDFAVSGTKAAMLAAT